jgi:mannobiose 2-epimerase
MQTLQSELTNELFENILPYWMTKMPDVENGGFYGRIDGQEHVHKQANKGLVLNARILWTFAAAYRLRKHPRYLETAERAFAYIREYFIDKEYGGVYWELDYRGRPVSTRKQIYAQGFALYGFSELYRATGNPDALEEALRMYDRIERLAHDARYGGYLEALSREWQPIGDMKLSARDANVPKSMNTHLHILEPYTNLLRIRRDPALEKAQEALIRIFCDHIVSAETHHLTLFFDERWNKKSTVVSYGHDIEAAWLLYEAAEVLGNETLTGRVKQVALSLVDAAYEGLQEAGGMMYESEGARSDRDRHWWIQAETVAGSVYAYRLSGDASYLDVAKKTWQYIRHHILDKVNGEWVWSAGPDGRQNRTDDKAGFWKCPYHNARMCMEVMNWNELKEHL